MEDPQRIVVEDLCLLGTLRMLNLLMPVITIGASLFRTTRTALGTVIRNRSNELLMLITIILVGFGVYHLGGKMSALISKTDDALTAVQVQTAKMDQQHDLLYEMINLQKGVIDFNQRLSEDYYANRDQRDQHTTDVVANIYNGGLRLRLNRPVGTGQTVNHSKARLQGTSTANQPDPSLSTFRVAVPTTGTFNPSSLGLPTAVN